MAENQDQLALIEKKIDRPTAGGITLSTQSGMLVRDVGEAMEVAKLMSISGSAVPAHIRNNPGTCLAVALQAWEWSMNPFAVANKSYVVNDRLAFESALYNAVVTRRAPIVGRLRIDYTGKGPTRQCTVSATLQAIAGGGEVDYQSPPFEAINPKNSPLWKNDPDQQLFYFSVRAFVRRHFPDVMMGVYTVDELQDTTPEMLPPGKMLAGTISTRKPREVVSVEVSKTPEKPTEAPVAPETAPQPKAKEEAKIEDDDAPLLTQPQAKEKPQDTLAPVAPLDPVAQIKAAWSEAIKKHKGWADVDPDLVDEQIENLCVNRLASKMPLADMAAQKPKWLPKLLSIIVKGEVPVECFDFNVTEAPATDAAAAPAQTEDAPAKPTRPGRGKPV